MRYFEGHLLLGPGDPPLFVTGWLAPHPSSKRRHLVLTTRDGTVVTVARTDLLPLLEREEGEEHTVVPRLRPRPYAVGVPAGRKPRPPEYSVVARRSAAAASERREGKQQRTRKKAASRLLL